MKTPPMDWLTFLATVIQHLAWPIVAVYTLSVLRQAIAQESKSLRAGMAVLRHACWWQPKPNRSLEAAKELPLFSIEDLRNKYQSAPGGDPAEAWVELRDGTKVSRKELREEILWRLARERRMNVIIVIGAVAAVIAAIEGWR